MPTVDEFLCDDIPGLEDLASSLLVPDGQEPSAPSRSFNTQDASGLEVSSDSWDASDDEESLGVSAGSCNDSDVDSVAQGIGINGQHVRAMLKHLQDGQANLADVQGKLQEMQLRVVSYVEDKFERHLREWKGELADEVASQLSHALGTAGGGRQIHGTATKDQWVVAQEQLSHEIDDLKADLAKHARHVAIMEERLEAFPTSPLTAPVACQHDQEDGVPKSEIPNGCMGKLTYLEEVVGTLLKTGDGDCHSQPQSTEEDETSDSCDSSSSYDSMPLCRMARPSCSFRAAARHGIPGLRLLPAAEQWPPLRDQPCKGEDSASGTSDAERGDACPMGPACAWYVLSPRVRNAPLAPRGLAPSRCQLLPPMAAPRGDRSP